MADALDALYVATITMRQQYVAPAITAADIEHELAILRAELVREIGA